MQDLIRILTQPLAIGMAGLLSAGLLLTNPIARAEDQSSGPSETQSIPDQKLDATAAAIGRMESIKKDYRYRIEMAPSSEKERIADEGKGALMKAVTDQGLSVDEFTSILTVAQNDPVVGKKIIQRIHPSDE